MTSSRSFFLGFVFLLLTHIGYTQKTKDKFITINFSNTSPAAALEKLNTVQGIRLSYNPDLIPANQVINRVYSNKSIDTILKDILGNEFELKYRGSYIIIQKIKSSTNEKNSFKITGGIKDATTGQALTNVTIYEVNKLSSTLSDNRGNFELTVSSKTDYVTFGISREYYQDTIIQVRRDRIIQQGILLRPTAPVQEKKQTFLKDLESRVKSIDTKQLVRFFTSKKERTNAQNVDLVEDRFFQLSFVPNVGTNMKMGGRIRNQFSFNMLAGYAYGLNGFELGGFYNIDRKEIKGLQIAGFGNAVGGESRATQIAGFINTNKSKTSGNQIAGFVNVVADEMSGVQLSGFNNIATKTDGVQITGFVNVATRGMTGLQLAGFNNTTANLTGTQISGFYNKAKEMDGFQLSGFINHAKTVRGTQFGIVNIADTVESGKTIGLINIVRKGLHQVAITHNDITDINLEFRGGTKNFYTILSTGMQVRQDFIWTYGFGFGKQINIKGNLYSNIEISTHVPNLYGTDLDEINILNRLNLNFGYQIAPHLSLNAGPVLNILVTRVMNEATGIYGYDLATNPFYDQFSGDTKIQMWLGYSASLKF